MSWANALFIAGTNVVNFPGVFAVDVIDGFYAPGDRRGDDYEIPGRHGAIGARLPYAKYLITIPLWVGGSTVAELNGNLHAIGELFRDAPNGDGLVQLERHLSTGPGMHVVHTAQGRYATGMNFQMVNHTQCHTDLQVYNLSGAWWNGSNWVVP